MRNWASSIRTVWKSLRTSDKGWFLAAILLLGLLGVGEMILHHGKPDVAILFMDLAAKDEAAVTAYLRTNGVPYGVRGSTLFVRKEMVDSLRAQIVGKQLLKGGDEGYRMLDKVSLGLTDMAQEINVLRAVEGEIAKTLKQMSFVQEASVRIQPQAESLYSQNEEPAKATVMLRIREGCQPTEGQIGAVANFVSGAYTRLRPSQVFIADQNGTILNATHSSAGGSNSRPGCIFGGR